VARHQVAGEAQQRVVRHEPRREEPLARAAGERRGGLDGERDARLVHLRQRRDQTLPPSLDLQGLGGVRLAELRARAGSLSR